MQRARNVSSVSYKTTNQLRRADARNVCAQRHATPHTQTQTRQTSANLYGTTDGLLVLQLLSVETPLSSKAEHNIQVIPAKITFVTFANTPPRECRCEHAII